MTYISRMQNLIKNKKVNRQREGLGLYVPKVVQGKAQSTVELIFVGVA